MLVRRVRSGLRAEVSVRGSGDSSRFDHGGDRMPAGRLPVLSRTRNRIPIHIAVALGVLSLVVGVASLSLAQPTAAAYSIWPDRVAPVVAADPSRRHRARHQIRESGARVCNGDPVLQVLGEPRSSCGQSLQRKVKSSHRYCSLPACAPVGRLRSLIGPFRSTQERPTRFPIAPRMADSRRSVGIR